ncbi:endonuclease domain-containing protein [Streptomyces sp. NPDC094466]|uniref:endonuclease domain-containing protein n=1 Tax=Streptomyces sp. NPDC094466 TaxID=3366065 RepID=UPI0038056AD3
MKRSVVDDGRGTCCSNACRYLAKWDRVSKMCEGCGTTFTVPQCLKERRRTCSRACWWKIMGADPGRSAILAQARHDLLTRRAPTRPERILYTLLDTLTAEADPSLRWERQLRLLNRWTVDAAIPSLRLVLQADGDYWHGLHPKDHTDPRVLRNMANDVFQDSRLTAEGWTVHRFWERDLIRDLPACTTRLRAAIAEQTAQKPG